MTNRVDQILDGTADGFVPAQGVQDGQAAWDAHSRVAAPEPAVEVEAESEPAPAAAPAPAEADIAALRAAGWSDADLQGISPEAAARHALREIGRREPARVERADESLDPDGLEAQLAEELGSKTAKKLAPLLRGITERQAALERGVRDSSLAGLRDAHAGQYPELARPEVERAVLAIAGPAPSREQYGRALRVLYGTRQAPDERAEARAQVSGQMTGGRRGPAPARDPEAANRAAWAEFQKTGDAARAIDVRRRLGG
jgi:hypothetical protein